MVLTIDLYFLNSIQALPDIGEKVSKLEKEAAMLDASGEVNLFFAAFLLRNALVCSSSLVLNPSVLIYRLNLLIIISWDLKLLSLRRRWCLK